MPARPGHSEFRGFTLIETVIVLVLIALVLAMAAPSLRGWSRGGKLRDAADQLLAVTRWARSQAVSTATAYQLQVDASGAGYALVQRDGQFWNPAPGEFGRIVTLPDACRVEILTTLSGPMVAVDFHPTGRTTPAVLRVSDNTGQAIDIACQSPGESFRILTTQTTQR